MSNAKNLRELVSRDIVSHIDAEYSDMWVVMQIWHKNPDSIRTRFAKSRETMLNIFNDWINQCEGAFDDNDVELDHNLDKNDTNYWWVISGDDIICQIDASKVDFDYLI